MNKESNVLSIQHLLVRLDQCMALSTISTCKRSQYGALLIDPADNIVLMDGYNTPLDTMADDDRSGFAHLCRGAWCARDGLTKEVIEVVHTDDYPVGQMILRRADDPKAKGFYLVHAVVHDNITWIDQCILSGPHTESELEEKRDALLLEYPYIAYGNQEIGCMCAERRLIFRCARRGVSTEGLWLLCTGSPCLACAKAIYAAGISRVVVIGSEDDDMRGHVFLEKNLEDGVHRLTREDIKAMGLAFRKKRRSK